MNSSPVSYFSTAKNVRRAARRPVLTARPLFGARLFLFLFPCASLPCPFSFVSCQLINR